MEKHPINDLINSETVSDIFLELEDTSKFDVDVQCEMGKPRSRELVRFYEMEIEKNESSVEDDYSIFKPITMKAIEKTYEVITYYKMAIIRVNKLYSTMEHSPVILRNDIDLKEIMGRAIDYISEENITNIYKGNLGVDRNHDPVVVINDDERVHLQCPTIIIYFKSYGAKEYK